MAAISCEGSSGTAALSAGAGRNPDSRRRRALIVDTRAVLGIEVCRTLHKLGWLVDVFAAPGSPAFRSWACHRRLVCPRLGSAFLTDLRSIVENGGYEAIYLCSEEILELLIASGNPSRWQAPAAVRAVGVENGIEQECHAGTRVCGTGAPARFASGTIIGSQWKCA